ncbi:anti-anti-sigma factor [Amycolatopsis keratiniphila]|uniref:STAS domain-containing protein n=1 Tax=Amycolatopsis keratiniphila TaxID=129921 RepID=UPI0033D91E63
MRAFMDEVTVERATPEPPSIDAFGEALADATRNGAAIVDLREVEYLDSGGINALFTHAERARIRTNELLVPVLTVSGLAELVDVER